MNKQRNIKFKARDHNTPVTLLVPALLWPRLQKRMAHLNMAPGEYLKFLVERSCRTARNIRPKRYLKAQYQAQKQDLRKWNLRTEDPVWHELKRFAHQHGMSICAMFTLLATLDLTKDLSRVEIRPPRVLGFLELFEPETMQTRRILLRARRQPEIKIR